MSETERAGQVLSGMALVAPQPETKSIRFADVRRRLSKHALGLMGLLLTLLPFAFSILVPLVVPGDPTAIDLGARFTPPIWVEGGTMEHPLGTDQLGRDMMLRLAYGGRISLLVGVLSVALGGVVGVVLGTLSGYLGGLFDQVLMAIADIQLSVPYIALAMAIIAIAGPGMQNVIVTLAVVNWVLYARVARAETLRIKQLEYIEAARALGANGLSIMVRHILPNLAPQLVVIATFGMATVIGLEAALSFLGLGIAPPTATWGRMLVDSREYIDNDIWQPTIPGVTLMITLLGINMLGDWLRDVWDPQLRRSGSG